VVVARSTNRLLPDVVELRHAIRETRERSVRERLHKVEHHLRSMIGPSVPKKIAAQALGVSVTALDKWIDRGVLPVVARSTSSRREVETVPLLDLLDQVTMLRHQGLERGVLAAAVRRLGWRVDPNGRQVLSEDVAALPRPNVPVWELREHFAQSTPQERVVEAASLSAALTRVAAARRSEV
jgi:hypothetical protein